MMFKALMFCMFVAAAIGAPATAQTAYPSKPIRLLVGFSAGGSTDIVGRLIADKLAEQLGQPVVVDNQAGAASAIAMTSLAKAVPDGHTLMLCTNAPLTNLQFLVTKLPYDPEEILPVTQIALIPYILLVPSSQSITSVRQLLALAKSTPAGLSYASAGMGGASHLSAETFQTVAGVRMVHVPYKGSGPAIIDLVAGRVHFMFDSEAAVASYLQAGSIRALAVGSGSRLPSQPNVPTFRELGYPFDAASWVGICAAPRTPQPVIDKLAAAMRHVMEMPQIQTRFQQLGVQPRSLSQKEFTELVGQEREQWRKLIPSLGIKMN